MWFCLFSSSFRWRREGGGAAVGGAQQQEREERGERRRVLGVLSLSRSTERRKLRAREENGARLEERRRKDRRQKKRKREKKTSPSPLALRVTTQSFFQLSSLPFLDLLLLAAGTQKPQEVSTRPALRSGGAARDGRGAKWRIPGGRGGASCRLKIGCSGFKRANCFSLASAAAQPPEGIAPPPPLACRLGSQHSTEAFAQAPLWPLRACRELRRLARRSARSDVRAAPGGAPSFPRDAHTNFEHSLLFFTSFTGAEPHSNLPIMPVTTSTVGEY